MKKYIWFIILGLLETSFLFTQSAYNIEVDINGFEGEEAILAFRRAEQTFSKDTASVENGKMVFTGDQALTTGIYLVLLPPKNNYFEFLITPTEQQFSIQTDTANLFENLKFTGSPENQIFLDYRKEMNETVLKSQALQAEIDEATNEKKKAKLQAKLEAMPDEVLEFQNTFIADHPNTFAGKIVSALKDVEIPAAPLGVDENKFNYFYLREHYWDGFDFTETGMVFTPYLQQKIDFYMDKLHTQTPDSLKIAVATLCEKAGVNKSIFRFTVSHLVNKYYRPRVVGLDEVYVFLANEYYCGRDPVADWVTDEVRKKVCDDAYMIKKVLIGNPAPNVTTQLYDYESESWTDSTVTLYDINAEYTVVFLWKPGCGHCKQATEDLKEFYAEYKNKDVEIFGITSATQKDLEKAKKDIQLKETTWPQTADPYLKARAMVNFYGTSLPKIYLLDENKKIIASRIAGSQVKGIIEHERKKKQQAKTGNN